MAKLIHEIWEEVCDGMTLHTCCLSGSLGEDCRRHLHTGARLLTTFEAGSHFEAMTIYNAYLDRGPYFTDQTWDYEPYPEEWFAEQQRHAESNENGGLKKRGILSIVGSMADRPEFDNAVEYGRYFRITGLEAPPDWKPGDPIPKPVYPE